MMIRKKKKVCVLFGMQIFGGNGYCKDFPVEKLMRDAKISMVCLCACRVNL